MNNSVDRPSQKKQNQKNKIPLKEIIGNVNCILAQKLAKYIRSDPVYKRDIGESTCVLKENNMKYCGTCNCKNNNQPHPTESQVNKNKTKNISNREEKFEQRKNILDSVGPFPSENPTTMAYISQKTQRPSYEKSAYEKNYIVENCMTNNESKNRNILASQYATGGCCCHGQTKKSSFGVQVTSTYKTFVLSNSIGVNTLKGRTSHESKQPEKTFSVFNFCTNIPEDTDCKCEAPKLTPPCKTFDCDCITESANKTARKHHKSYCPCFKHKSNCPVMASKEEELEEEEDEPEPLPYGLPPITLGPCPVIGRPCAYPDGFARMYRTQALAALPPSYDNTGKVCCMKEFERIKKALDDYMKIDRENDYRCINAFNIDTERRCCDKEDILKALIGKDCCGSHKLALNNKFHEEKR